MFGGFFNTINPWQSSQSTPKEKPFYSNFFGEANFYLVKGQERTLRGYDSLVKFTSSPDSNWNYTLVVEPNEQKSGDNSTYAFPMTTEMNLVQDFPEGTSSTIFEFDLDKINKVQLEFETDKDDFSFAQKFLYNYSRLMYQVENKKSYTEATSPDAFASYHSFRKESNPKITPQVQELLERLASDKTAEFYAAGEFSMYNPEDAAGTLKVLNPQWVLVIRSTTDKYSYVIEVLSGPGSTVLTQPIDENLHWHIDENQNLLTWLGAKDMDSKSKVAFNFKMMDAQAGPNLQMIFQVCVLQASEKQTFEKIIQNENKKDWDQFYMNNGQNNESNNGFNEDYDQYRKSNKMRIEFSNDLHYADSGKSDAMDMDIAGMSQAKVIDRTFINRGSILEAYKNDGGNSLQHIANLPALKTQKGEEIKPAKMFLQEHDTKMVFNDDSKVFYYDLEKGKIVSDMQTEGKNKFEDICPFQKSLYNTPKQEFFGVTERDVVHFDPRLANGIAEDRHYKTNYQFNTVMSATDGNVAVGSKTGDVRLIKKVGDRSAKNVLPSMLGDMVNGIDSSKDGQWVLATCDKYLLLFPTNQMGSNGFNKTFLKTQKPAPKVLRVNPKALAKHKISTDLKFLSARFDDKKEGPENYIVASSGPFMFVWTMKNVLKGNYVTSEVKRLTNDIVSNEFLYDTDSLLAAFKKGLVIQDTKEFKR